MVQQFHRQISPFVTKSQAEYYGLAIGLWLPGTLGDSDQRSENFLRHGSVDGLQGLDQIGPGFAAGMLGQAHNHRVAPGGLLAIDLPQKF